jgi:cardiolipin synthase
MIGSMNLDNRSMALNEESVLLIHDAAIGARLDSIFELDLAATREILLPEFSERGWIERVREWIANRWSALL